MTFMLVVYFYGSVIDTEAGFSAFSRVVEITVIVIVSMATTF